MAEACGFAPAREIVRMRAGSHLYGTATPRSDLDLKAVVLPGARDILLQRVRPTATEGRPRAPGERNTPDDVDVEAHGLQRYLALLAAGQPVAVEMLLAPEAAFTALPDPLWREVQSLGLRLLTRRVGVFLRYCRKQAELYGAKSARIAVARRVAGVLAAAEDAHGAQARLERAAARTESARRRSGTRDPVGCGGAARTCGAPPGGVRAQDAVHGHAPHGARGDGAGGGRIRPACGAGGAAGRRGLKGVLHAVRVGQEAVELLSTGRHGPVTLPVDRNASMSFTPASRSTMGDAAMPGTEVDPT